MERSILIVANVDWFLISHRLVIAKAALGDGWKVFVACEDTGRAYEIEDQGIKFVPLSFSRSGTNLLGELNTIFKFLKLYNRIKPDVVHQITLKPVVYGSFVARILGVKSVVNAISGLGYSFTAGRKSIVQRFILGLLRIGFNRIGLTVIFQNDDDKLLLGSIGALSPVNRIELIKGSGVDLKKFAFCPLPSNSDRIKILLPCRMLWDKGVRELYEATKKMKDKYYANLSFILVGMCDEENKAGVSEKFLEEWQDGDYVKWLGHIGSMVEMYRDSHIVVLPSYREGLPKSLIEACAIGRPIVTTDAVGCRDCVDEGINGFKVPVGDSDALVDCFERFIANPELMVRMGKAGRLKAEKEFDVEKVIEKHLEIYNSEYSL